MEILILILVVVGGWVLFKIVIRSTFNWCK